MAEIEKEPLDFFPVFVYDIYVLSETARHLSAGCLHRNESDRKLT